VIWNTFKPGHKLFYYFRALNKGTTLSRPHVRPAINCIRLLQLGLSFTFAYLQLQGPSAAVFYEITLSTKPNYVAANLRVAVTCRFLLFIQLSYSPVVVTVHSFVVCPDCNNFQSRYVSLTGKKKSINYFTKHRIYVNVSCLTVEDLRVRSHCVAICTLATTVP